MAKDTVEILIEGGSATPGPPLGPALGPFGINMMQVVEEINNKSADFAGMKVPVKVSIDRDTKEFEIETEMTIHAIDKNMFIKNVVIDYRDRIEGSESKLNTYSDGIKVLMTIIRLYKNYKPFGFFGAISLVLILLSALFFVPVVFNYIQTGQVPNFPTLMVCGFTAVAAVQCYFSGMILSTIVSKNKQEFEYKLMNTAKSENEDK